MHYFPVFLFELFVAQGTLVNNNIYVMALSAIYLRYLTLDRLIHRRIGGFHAISGDTNNNGEMNKCWWTNKTS